MTILCAALAIMSPAPESLWKKIPANDPAVKLLELVRSAQPTTSDLPENSTFNYIWAENMMAWMVAEKSGLMPRSECVGRLTGLLTRVRDWETHHGFYFDAYDPATGKRKSDNVYFQGWWLWALILVKNAYPEAAPLANKILLRLDYHAAGMISDDNRLLIADRNIATGKMTFYLRPSGEVSGEMRTPIIAYTYLTGDITPWQITEPNTFIDVGGKPILAVWHHFTFDPFYVHSCFPELGYFQKSYDNLVAGANRHREQNGMTFYATRMDPLEAWTEDADKWPNTEHRVSKPWTAWLTDPSAPVMERAWVPGYGVLQVFDNWNFSWGYGGVTGAHPKAIDGQSAFDATFYLEPFIGVHPTDPPKLTKVVLNVQPDPQRPPTGDLVVTVNGSVVGAIKPSDSLSLSTPTTITPLKAIQVGNQNVVRLETRGQGAWLVGQTAKTFRPVQWQGSDVPAIGLTVFVNGQRPDRENPFAFLCRASGAYGNFPWKLLPESDPDGFGKHLVAWVGSYSTLVRYAHLIYNVDTKPVEATYALSSWEVGKRWTATDAKEPGKTIPLRQMGNVLTWSQQGRQTVRIQARK